MRPFKFFYGVIEPSDRDPVLILRVERSRSSIGEPEWRHLLEVQRTRLVTGLWLTDRVRHEIIYQDENSFTLRTELIDH